MIVYRLEVWRDSWAQSEDWRGPYDHTSEDTWDNPNPSELDALISRLLSAHADSAHPSPAVSGFYEWHYECHRLGCDSMESLERWFGIFIKEFLATGKARIAKYKMPSEAIVFNDGRQVVFEIDKAKLVEA